MAKPSQAILDFKAKYGIDSDELWEVHGSTWVVKHKALERVAAEQGIVWDRPAIIENNSKEGCAAVCVFGKLGERTEWSIGEALVGVNYMVRGKQAAYVWAMAEKRAKDRVILKLLTAHGVLYSEAEADEFAERRPNPHVTRPDDVFTPTEYDQYGQPVDNIPAPDEEAVQRLRVADQKPIFAAMQKEIHATSSIKELTAWAETNRNRLGTLKPDFQEFLRGVYAEHRDELRKQEQGDDLRMAG